MSITLLARLFMAGSLFLSFASAQDAGKPGQDKGEPEGYRFTPVCEVSATPVRDQQRAGTCWSYSSIGMVESEMLRIGRPPINLSEMFVVRMCYEEKADRYVRMHGTCNFGGGGAVNDAFDVLAKYGAMPESAYTGLHYGTEVHTHGELDEVLKDYLDGVIKNRNRKLSTAWKAGFRGILDAYLGEVPASFDWNGKNYTPRTFADEVVGVDPNDYVFFTSYTHHPFYRQFVLEVPDNWTWSRYWNVPLDEMIELIDGSLKAGYSVVWASDVSEAGFASKRGVAVVPETDPAEMADSERLKWESMDPAERLELAKDFACPMPEKHITQEMRQRAFDDYQTTDDHGMLLTGIAEDQNGTKYYHVKNSWGADYNHAFKGYFYASESFVRFKTMSWGMHKNAIPAELKAKLGIR